MHRHELDPLSLFAGLVFTAVAGAYALTHTTGLRLHWLLAVPVVLVLMGVAVIGVVVRRMSPAAAAERTPGQPADAPATE